MLTKEVVITGIGMISPVGNTIDASWNNLINGNSGIDVIKSFDTSEMETKIAGEIKDFNPIDLIGKKESRRMDRFSQLAIVASQEALNSAQLNIDVTNEHRVSVMITSGIGGIITISEQIDILRDKGPSRISPFLVPMMLPDMASAQVSMKFGAKGPNFAVVSACASGGDSIGIASEFIKSNRVDIVLAGGSEAAICPIGIAGFNACHALSKNNSSPKQASKPFDNNRDGFVLSEGAAVLVLESRESANKRGVNILATLAGYGSSADANHITQPAPGGEGGVRAMNEAIVNAEINTNQIDYINAHGTSTPINDKFETMAMKTVFGTEINNIAISSTKSMTGHLLAASGAIEAAISVKSLNENIVPPTINLNEPDPECDLNYTPNKSLHKNLFYTMSNSFGFGGHNCSLIFSKPSN
ncbi:MAG TPA: beta-ketoacyl-[acyl-carrier-protein] synthase II [Dehalococcoidia bacterium]|nr:beta-ketoacyl-[acyl-carrier-protein] synthase II [Dehalococcoidia bacterium]